ncbi:hypothetical protein PAHAL_5G327900 [Panicum hallii]|uniref:Uncharacterized protein n=1 Tax=Panicum hallii TaxID=206008 RepID=A0A2T8ILY3_9POAL|nr:hypothetical protein PAHAL_5G327900 [Panicum hallii]
MTREENARLRLKNEKLREENREMGLMQRRKVCGICILKAENARLKAELERLEAIAAMRRNKANPKEELGSSSSAFQTPTASSATGSQPDSGADVPKEETPSM